MLSSMGGVGQNIRELTGLSSHDSRVPLENSAHSDFQSELKSMLSDSPLHKARVSSYSPHRVENGARSSDSACFENSDTVKSSEEQGQVVEALFQMLVQLNQKVASLQTSVDDAIEQSHGFAFEPYQVVELNDLVCNGHQMSHFIRSEKHNVDSAVKIYAQKQFVEKFVSEMSDIPDVSPSELLNSLNDQYRMPIWTNDEERVERLISDLKLEGDEADTARKSYADLLSRLTKIEEIIAPTEKHGATTLVHHMTSEPTTRDTQSFFYRNTSAFELPSESSNRESPFQGVSLSREPKASQERVDWTTQNPFARAESFSTPKTDALQMGHQSSEPQPQFQALSRADGAPQAMMDRGVPTGNDLKTLPGNDVHQSGVSGQNMVGGTDQSPSRSQALSLYAKSMEPTSSRQDMKPQNLISQAVINSSENTEITNTKFVTGSAGGIMGAESTDNFKPAFSNDQKSSESDTQESDETLNFTQSIDSQVRSAPTGTEKVLKPTTPNLSSMDVQGAVSQAQIIAQKGGGEMRIQLNPEGMGELNMKVSVNEGQVSVQFVTENQDVKKLLEAKIPDLKSSLENHRLHLDHVRVDMSEKTTQQNSLENSFNRHQAREFMENFRQSNENFRRSMYESLGQQPYQTKGRGAELKSSDLRSGHRPSSARRLDLVA